MQQLQYFVNFMENAIWWRVGMSIQIWMGIEIILKFLETGSGN